MMSVWIWIPILSSRVKGIWIGSMTVIGTSGEVRKWRGRSVVVTMIIVRWSGRVHGWHRIYVEKERDGFGGNGNRGFVFPS